MDKTNKRTSQSHAYAKRINRSGLVPPISVLLATSRTLNEADARAFIALVKSGSPEDVLRQFLARYRATKGHT